MGDARSAADGRVDGDEIRRLDRTLAALVERIDHLERENERLRAAPPATDQQDRPADRRQSSGSLTRRRLLLGGAGAAAAGGLAAVAGVSPAAATNGQPIVQGVNNSGTNTTPIYATGGDHGWAITAAGDSGGVRANIYGQSSGITVAPATSALVGDANAGTGVTGLSNTGYGGYFYSNENSGALCQSQHFAGMYATSSTSFGVYAVSGSGIAVSALTQTGSGVSAQVNAGTVGSNAVHGSMAGAGVAGRFENTSSSNVTAALYGVTAGSGQGVKGNGTAGATGVVGTSTDGLGGQFGGKRAAVNLIPTKTAGRPTSGAHAAGDLVVDSVGALFLCTGAGTPGTWAKVTTTSA